MVSDNDRETVVTNRFDVPWSEWIDNTEAYHEFTPREVADKTWQNSIVRDLIDSDSDSEISKCVSCDSTSSSDSESEYGDTPIMMANAINMASVARNKKHKHKRYKVNSTNPRVKGSSSSVICEAMQVERGRVKPRTAKHKTRIHFKTEQGIRPRQLLHYEGGSRVKPVERRREPNLMMSDERHRLLDTLKRKIAEQEDNLAQAVRIRTTCTIAWNKKRAPGGAAKEMHIMEMRQAERNHLVAQDVLQQSKTMYENMLITDRERQGRTQLLQDQQEVNWPRGRQVGDNKPQDTGMLDKYAGRGRSPWQPNQRNAQQEQAIRCVMDYRAATGLQPKEETLPAATLRERIHESTAARHNKNEQSLRVREYEVITGVKLTAKECFDIGKNPQQYTIQGLVLAMNRPDLSMKTERVIREELRRRGEIQPNLASVRSDILWDQLRNIMKTAGLRTLTQAERNRVTEIQHEIYARSMHTERLRLESGVRGIVRGSQQAKNESQIDALRKQIADLNDQNSKWSDQFQQLAKSSDRICGDIQRRLSELIVSLSMDITDIDQAEKEGDKAIAEEEENQIIVHMLESRKDKLRAGVAVPQTQAEQARRDTMALESQRRAQAQTMKVQQKRTELLARTQRNTIARLEKISLLEDKLKKLAQQQRTVQGNEFVMEAVDREIDKRIEDNGDFLIGQYYLGVGSQQLYQVIDVMLDKTKRPPLLVSIARPIDNVENCVEVQNDRQQLPVHGINGAVELISRFEQGQKDYDDIPLPKSSADWLNAQKSDPHIREILLKLGSTPNAILPLDNKPINVSEEYMYRDVSTDTVTQGILMRRTMREKRIEMRDITATVQQEYRQIVVPDSMKEKIIWIMHDQMGHPGRNRTTETIKLRYHWSGMYTDVMNYCKNCRYCNLRKAHNRVAKVPIMVYNYAERPNSRVHFDTAGPFPLAKNGGYYILVLKDALTKWITTIPVHSKDMYTVQKSYLDHWTSIYGAPDMLITDRGTEFHNIMAKQLAELWGVRKIATTPKNPRSDGQVENQMRTVKDMLASYIKKNQNDWDEYLPLVSQAYNSVCNDATGFTPYFLMYGREMNMASEDHTESVNVDDFHDMVVRVKEIQQWYWNYVGERVVKNSENMTSRVIPVERLVYKPYVVGDFFYHRVVPKRAYKSVNEEKAEKISSKLQFRYVGPYMVTEVVSPVVYGATIHGKYKRVHSLNMKPASTGRKDKSRRGLPVVVEEQPTRVQPTRETQERMRVF